MSLPFSGHLQWSGCNLLLEFFVLVFYLFIYFLLVDESISTYVICIKLNFSKMTCFFGFCVFIICYDGLCLFGAFSDCFQVYDALLFHFNTSLNLSI